MQPVSSILVVVDLSPAAADAVAKAVLLARRFKARVELFMCDAERGYALSQAYIPAGVREAQKACVERIRTYLESLKQAAAAPDVPITVDAACESPLYESVVRKVMRERPDLVIKNATCAKDQTAVSFDATDWQLMRTCPATLLLTRGRAWQLLPRFAAAIDASGTESAEVAGNILQAARLLLGCAGGELDVIYAEPVELEDAERESGTHALYELVENISDAAPRVHVLSGDPEVSLPKFVSRNAYDAMLLGALTHKPAYTAQVGTLTSKLVEAAKCDFLLVKPTAYRSPIPAARVRRTSEVMSKSP